jgi:hypothetical protein
MLNLSQGIREIRRALSKFTRDDTTDGMTRRNPDTKNAFFDDSMACVNGAIAVGIEITEDQKFRRTKVVLLNF